MTLKYYLCCFYLLIALCWLQGSKKIKIKIIRLVFILDSIFTAALLLDNYAIFKVSRDFLVLEKIPEVPIGYVNLAR